MSYLRIDNDKVGIVPELPTEILSASELQGEINEIESILSRSDIDSDFMLQAVSTALDKHNQTARTALEEIRDVKQILLDEIKEVE